MTVATPYLAHVASLVTGYRQLLSEHELDAIVVGSGQAAARSQFDDQHWPHVVTPAFAHWLPLPAPDAFVVVTEAGPPRLVRVMHADFWDSAPTAEVDDFWDGFAVEEVASLADAVARLPRGRVALIGERVPEVPGARLNPPAVVAGLEALRTRKSPYEVACLREASARAVAGHRHIEQLFERFEVSELATHLGYLAASGQSERDLPYQNIVARGRHAAVLHHVLYDQRLPNDGRPGPLSVDSLLIDAGARYLGYCADITRTWIRGDAPGANLFRRLRDGLDQLQQQVCAAVKVGLAYETLHDHTHDLLAVLLIDLEIGQGGADDLVERGVTRALFPHGLGHSLGIQVHDVGLRQTAPRADNQFLRNTSTIAAGQVFTIEPGCYVIDALIDPLRADDRRGLLDWHAIEALRPFGGIRIEDNLVVTATGVDNLTRGAWAA